MGLPQNSLRQDMQNSVLGGQFPTSNISEQTQILLYHLAIRKQFATSALRHTKYPADLLKIVAANLPHWMRNNEKHLFS